MQVVSGAELDRLILSKPEIGLQSYEFLNGDKNQRDAAQAAFLSEAIYAPDLGYPDLNNGHIKPKIEVLDNLFNLSVDSTDLAPEAKDAYVGTTGYRLAEAYFLAEAIRLNDPSAPFSLFKTRARRYQSMNEQLYGLPADHLSSLARNEMARKLEAKQVVGSGRQIEEELRGLWPDIFEQKDDHRLPQITEEAATFLAEQIEQKYDVEAAQVKAAWQDITDIEKMFAPDAMVEVFSAVISARGLETLIGVFMTNATRLAWSQERAGVEVGGNRSAIKTPEEMLGLVVHEEGVHGRRFVNGRQSRVPILGNGLYTEADEGESPDYLSFEEGIAALYQSIASGEKQGWTMANLTHQLSLGLAYEGKDFRGVFERMWRLRALITNKSGEDISIEQIAKARKMAYGATVRIFRGTPTHRAHEVEHPLTYNKDLAYLVGRVAAINFWNQNAGNEDLFDALLWGKFDPTNKRHMKIANFAARGSQA